MQPTVFDKCQGYTPCVFVRNTVSATVEIQVSQAIVQDQGCRIPDFHLKQSCNTGNHQVIHKTAENSRLLS